MFHRGAGMVEVSSKPGAPGGKPVLRLGPRELGLGNQAACLNGDTFPVDEVPYRAWFKFRMQVAVVEA